MPEYRFAVARRYELAFAFLQARLTDDAAAISFAEALGTGFPQASAVTVGCKDRVVARVSVNLPAKSNSVAKQVSDSKILIAEARRLLAATSGAQSVSGKKPDRDSRAPPRRGEGPANDS